MASLAQKLQIKPGQSLLLLNLPENIRAGFLQELDGVIVSDELDVADGALMFITEQSQVSHAFQAVIQKARPGGLVWLAYPKGGSAVKTDLSRDKLWQAVGTTSGWQGIRLVSLDETWSAMRFRPADQVGK